ncbi:MAG: DUF417 family protein [Luteimonas sp.]
MSAAVLKPHSYQAGVAASGERSEALGVIVLRAGLGLIFLWFGAIKFTGIGAVPLMVNSPLLSWLPASLGLAGASHFLGVFELATGVLLWAGFAKPILSAIGGAMAAFTLLLTVSLMFSTPGVAEPLAGGFPALSAIPGQFLLKDVGLLGIAIFIAGESLWRARSVSPATLTTGHPPTTVRFEAGARIMAIGTTGMRYGLALIFLWFGAMKFTSYEATGIAPFIANSPLVGWWHSTLGIQGASTMLGVFEIATAVLLAICPVAPRACVVDAAMAVLTFLITLSFLFSTPGVSAPVGFPVLSDVGEFLLKDVGLLGISILLLGQALRSVAGRPASTERARA